MIKLERIIIVLLVCAWLYIGAFACTVMFVGGDVRQLTLKGKVPLPEKVEAAVMIEMFNIGDSQQTVDEGTD